MISRYLISIRNISWTVSNSQLERYFSEFGDVKIARVIFNRHGLSTGYGFVEFYDEVAVTSVLNKDHVLDNEKLSIATGLRYLYEDPVKQFVEKYILDADTCRQ